MRNPKVLIIDDTAMNIALAQTILVNGGFEVESAGDAAQAMQRMCTFMPDLILMDIQMPGMDGLQLTGILKSNPATSHIGVIAFTAYAMRGDEEHMRSMECDGYISKPINIKTFCESVRSHWKMPEPSQVSKD